jgi:hypothetical protein
MVSELPEVANIVASVAAAFGYLVLLRASIKHTPAVIGACTVAFYGALVANVVLSRRELR